MDTCQCYAASPTGGWVGSSGSQRASLSRVILEVRTSLLLTDIVLTTFITDIWFGPVMQYLPDNTGYYIRWTPSVEKRDDPEGLNTGRN